MTNDPIPASEPAASVQPTVGALMARVQALRSTAWAGGKAYQQNNDAEAARAIERTDEQVATIREWLSVLAAAPPQGAPAAEPSPFGARTLEDAYAEGRRDEQEELASVLPGTTYMDPPDGGAPTILEQLQRQAKDAARYLWLRAALLSSDRRKWDKLAVLLNIAPDTGAGVDDAVDAAMAQGEGKTCRE